MGANVTIDRLNWMRGVQGPMLRSAMNIGEIDLRLMLAQALHMVMNA